MLQTNLKSMIEFSDNTSLGRKRRGHSNNTTMKDLPKIKGSDRKYWKKKPVHKDWFQKCDDNTRIGKIKRNKSLGIKNVHDLEKKYNDGVMI